MTRIEQPTAFDRTRTTTAPSSVLLDADIDRVMAGLDRIVEAAPSYRKLFSRWEKQHWNSESFDFTAGPAPSGSPDLWTDASASTCSGACRRSSSARSA